jgi:hypothetical protein
MVFAVAFPNLYLDLHSKRLELTVSNGLGLPSTPALQAFDL